MVQVWSKEESHDYIGINWICFLTQNLNLHIYLKFNPLNYSSRIHSRDLTLEKQILRNILKKSKYANQIIYSFISSIILANNDKVNGFQPIAYNPYCFSILESLFSRTLIAIEEYQNVKNKAMRCLKAFKKI